MSFHCMMKHSKVEIELLHDIDMSLMLESGIRGGITQAVKYYSKANNRIIVNYDSNKLNYLCGLFICMLPICEFYIQFSVIIIFYVIYFYSYGWVMQQRLPLYGFKWFGEDNLSVDKILNVLQSFDEKSLIGYVLEVYVLYPQNPHDEHNDIPYLSENTCRREFYQTPSFLN